MRLSISLLTVFLLFASACQAGTKLDDVQGIDKVVNGRKVVEDLLSREHLFYDKSIHYAESCTVVGALRFADKINDKELINRIVSRYEIMLEPENKLFIRHPHLDHDVTGIIPLHIYLVTGDKRYLRLGLTFADNQWENPREDGLTSRTRWWIDDMYMVGMLQVQAFRATGDVKYADRAALQIAAYLRRLQQPNGLFYHGPEYHYHWGRGNGWVAAAMAELLKSLPDDHKLRPEILASYKKMMQALQKYQGETGMWRQLIDYQYSWAESSCTAMFAYAMSAGVNNGWLDKNSYGPTIDKAWKALCAHLNRKGQLREICTGTGQQDDIEYYLTRPRVVGDFHGQAPFLWLTSELLNK